MLLQEGGYEYGAGGEDRTKESCCKGGSVKESCWEEDLQATGEEGPAEGRCTSFSDSLRLPT